MKKYSTLLFCGTALLMIAACSHSDEMDMEPVPQDLTDIRVVAPAFEWDYRGSRLHVELETDGFKTFWSNNDTLGILPDNGAQVPFPIQMEKGQSSHIARFTGGGWALKPAATYSAYYPYIGDIYLDKNNIPLSFTGQWQKEKTSYEHLSPYIYMATNATTPNEGAVNLELQHLGCYTVFCISVPEPTAFASMKLVSESPCFVQEAKINLSQSDLAITPTLVSDTMAFNLEGVTTTAPNEEVELSFIFAPTQLKGKTLKAILRDVDGYEEEINIEGRDLCAGCAYKFNQLKYVTYSQHEPPHWTFNDQDKVFQSGMTAVVTLPESMKKQEGTGDELAAFINGELRGVGQFIDGAYYMMVHGNIGEKGKVSFKYYNHKKKYLYEAKDVVDFNTDLIFGVTDYPELLPLKVIR